MTRFTRRDVLKLTLAAGGTATLISPLAIPRVFAASPEFLTFNGGGQGGAWHLGAAAMAELAKGIWPNVSTIAQPGGGKSNPRLLAAKKVEIAFGFGHDMAAAYQGSGDFEGRKMDNLRAIMSTNAAYVTTIAHPDIKSFEDLKGKSVATGRPGMTGFASFRAIAAEYGLEDYKEVNSGYAEMPSLFKDGVVSAVTVIGSIPHPVIDEITSSHDGNILAVTTAVQAALVEKHNFEPTTIPNGTWKIMDADVNTIGAVTQCCTHADVPEEWIYALTKTTWENRKRMVQAHKVYAALDEKMVTSGVRIPYHPGAERYWKEIGIL